MSRISEVDIETQLDIVEIGANAIHVELLEIRKTLDTIAEKLDRLEVGADGVSE